MLKATIISAPEFSSEGDRLFLNDVEFPWPLYPDNGIGYVKSFEHPEKWIVALDVLVDAVSYREAPSD